MNQFNIKDFSKKIDDSASKLDELIDRASKANNVGDMLDQTNNRLNETLKTLKDIYEDLSILTEQFEQCKKQLSDTAGLWNSTSEDLIQKMDTHNSDLTDKMAQTEIKLNSIASHLTEQFEQCKKQLSDTAGLWNSTSEDLIEKMDTLNSDLADKIAQTEIKLNSIASYTKKILYTIIVFLILGTSYYLYKFKVSIF